MRPVCERGPVEEEESRHTVPRRCHRRGRRRSGDSDDASAPVTNCRGPYADDLHAEPERHPLRGAARVLALAREERKPDILCLQELRATPTDVDDALHSPRGYSTRWQCAEKKGYAGVALYSRERADRYVAGHGIRPLRDEGRACARTSTISPSSACTCPAGSSSAAAPGDQDRVPREPLPWFDRSCSRRSARSRCAATSTSRTGDRPRAPEAEREELRASSPRSAPGSTRSSRRAGSTSCASSTRTCAGLYSFWSNRGQAREKDIGWRLDYVLATPALAPKIRRAWIETKAGLSDHAPVWVEVED